MIPQAFEGQAAQKAFSGYSITRRGFFIGKGFEEEIRVQMFKRTISLISIELLFMVLLSNSVVTDEMKQSETVIDKARLLKDKDVFGTFSIFRLDSSRNLSDEMAKAGAVEKVKKSSMDTKIRLL
tara:strand:- start:323 stop:697 length:375 start_codon:yes stop_codon:yes gene_type:complete